MKNREEQERTVIPVAEEKLEVGVRQVEDRRVRVRKRVHEREEVVDQPLSSTAVDVQRVPVGDYVEERLGTRYEGNTTIIPIYEEVVVVEKRLLLKEEIHITRHESTRDHHERVTIRSEEAI